MVEEEESNLAMATKEEKKDGRKKKINYPKKILVKSDESYTKGIDGKTLK